MSKVKFSNLEASAPLLLLFLSLNSLFPWENHTGKSDNGSSGSSTALESTPTQIFMTLKHVMFLRGTHCEVVQLLARVHSMSLGNWTLWLY